MSEAFMLLVAGFVICAILAAAGVVIVWVLRKKGETAPTQISDVSIVAERVRAVGKLVGLEVHAKEIATSTKGWSWIPPLLLSQAKVAMIFHFDKQYFVDLSKLRQSDVEQVGYGRFRLTLPAIEGSLRLSDLTPYDIQAGRIFALFDVIQMNAGTQKELIRTAQDQASQLFESHEGRYVADARRAVEKQVETLLSMFDAEVEIVWRGEGEDAREVVPELAASLAGR